MDVIITIMLRTTRKSLTVSLFTIRLGKLRDNNGRKEGRKNVRTVGNLIGRILGENLDNLYTRLD